MTEEGCVSNITEMKDSGLDQRAVGDISTGAIWRRSVTAWRMTAAEAAETRMSHRATRVRVAPVLAPRSLSRQVRNREAVSG